MKRGHKPPRPKTKDRILLPDKAKTLLVRNLAQFCSVMTRDRVDLDWVREGYDFVVIGGTGNGLGFAIACALADHLGKKSSITVLANDPARSFAAATAIGLRKRYHRLGRRLQIINHFMDTGTEVIPPKKWYQYPFLESIFREPEPQTAFRQIRDALVRVNAKRLIYINALHFGFPGLREEQRGYPFFVPDLAINPRTGGYSLVQEKMVPLTARERQLNRYVMGDLATAFAEKLRAEGFPILSENYCTFRGCLDPSVANPESPTYGQWLGWSGSISEPKIIINQYANRAKFQEGRTDVMVHRLPILRTDGLITIPGGLLMSHVFARLAAQTGATTVDIPELAIQVLNRIGQNLRDPDSHQAMVAYDGHESVFDEEAFTVFREVNVSPNSHYYFKRYLM